MNCSNLKSQLPYTYPSTQTTKSAMHSTNTVAPVEHEQNSGSALDLENRAIGAHHPKPASPPGDDRLVHPASVASADADADSSNTDDDDDDDDTQSDADDESGGSSDGTGPETEALEKEMERYVPRTKPSKPAIGAQPPNLPYAQGKTATSHSQATKSGRPAAVTATGKTTAPRPKKK